MGDKYLLVYNKYIVKSHVKMVYHNIMIIYQNKFQVAIYFLEERYTIELEPHYKYL